MRRPIAYAVTFIITGSLAGGVAEAQSQLQCPNEVVDNTQSTQQGVNTKTGDIAAACENGKQYIVEKKTSSVDCRPTTLTINWQRGVNENTNHELLRKYPPRLFMRNVDGKVEDLGTGCPEGKDIEKLLTDPHAHTKLGLDEIERVDDVDEKFKLQQELSKEVSGAIDKSFDGMHADWENQLRIDALASQANQAKTVGDLVQLHSEAGDLEAELKASGASPQTIAQATALKTEVAALTRSQFGLQQEFAQIDAVADRKLLSPSYTPSQQMGIETFGSSLAKSDALVPDGHGVIMPSVTDWNKYYVDTTGSVGATAVGTPAVAPPVSNTPPIPTQAPGYTPPLPVKAPDVQLSADTATLSAASAVTSPLPPAAQSATTLSQLWQATGESYCSVDCRIQRYGSQCNISSGNYSGTGAQNTALLRCIQGQ